MKFKIISMLVVIGMLSVLPMIYMGKLDPMAMLNGNFGNDIGLGNIDSIQDAGKKIAILKEKAPKNLSTVTTDEKVQVYKWRDENGVLQFSNTPPAHMKNAEQIELNPNHNVVEATKVPEVEVRDTSSSPQAQVHNPYTPGGMKQAVENAQGIEAMLQDRADQQKKMMDRYSR